MVSAPAISRVRDTVRDRDRETSPTESSSSHPGSSSADPSHAPSISAIPQPPPTTNQLLLAAGEKPLSDRDLQKSKEIWSKRYALSDAWTDLAPHKEEVVRGLEFTGRQVAWSTAGELCVVVGSAGVIGVFERWSGVG
jgi:polycomb protein EED